VHQSAVEVNGSTYAIHELESDGYTRRYADAIPHNGAPADKTQKNGRHGVIVTSSSGGMMC
jgi:hypothetical protein